MDASPNETRGAAMNRVMDVGHEHNTILVCETHDEMRNALLPTAHAQDLALWIDGDAESPVHVRRGCLEEARRSAEGRVAVRRRVAVRASDGLDDRSWRRMVGIPDAEVEKRCAARAGGSLELIEPREHVGRQRRQAVRRSRHRCRGRLGHLRLVERRVAGRTKWPRPRKRFARVATTTRELQRPLKFSIFLIRCQWGLATEGYTPAPASSSADPFASSRYRKQSTR